MEIFLIVRLSPAAGSTIVAVFFFCLNRSGGKKKPPHFSAGKYNFPRKIMKVIAFKKKRCGNLCRQKSHIMPCGSPMNHQ